MTTIGPHGLSVASKAWSNNAPEEAAAIAHLLCGLVWKSLERLEEPELGTWFEQIVPRDYIAKENLASTENHLASAGVVRLHLLEDIDKPLRDLVQYALRVMVEAPNGLFRQLPREKWRGLQDLLDGLALYYYRKVQELINNLPTKLLLQQTKLILLVGRLYQQTWFRKIAVRYYDMLARACEKIPFQVEFRRAVVFGQAQANRSLKEYNEQRAAANQEEIFIPAGKHNRSETLQVKVRADQPVVFLELMPDSG